MLAPLGMPIRPRVRASVQVPLPPAMARLFGVVGAADVASASSTADHGGADGLRCGEDAGGSLASIDSGDGMCSFVVAAPPLVPAHSLAVRGSEHDSQAAGLLRACDWRASAALQQSHFLCPQCHLASPVASTRCLNPECQSLVALLDKRTSPEEVAAMRALSSSSSYARGLRFLQGRGQACMHAQLSRSPALSLTLH